MSTTLDQAVVPVRFERYASVRIDPNSDGRTLVGRLVPYNEVALVDDGQGPYRERFLPGAFKAQMRAATRIKAFVNYRHGQALEAQIGHAKEIIDREDGLHGELRILETPNGDTALKLVEAGVLDSLSIEFESRQHRTVNGVVERSSARLLGVALVPEGAYQGAQVLAVREGEPVLCDVEELPPLDPMLAVGLSRFGISVAEETLARAFSETSWDGSASRWDTADAYCAASAIDMNMPGRPKTKDACHLPYREPGSGAMNVNAIRAALARLGAGEPADVPAAERLRARLMFERMLAQHNSQQGKS